MRLEFWSAVYAYPIDSGGRPLNSWPIFLLVPFEVGVLAAAVAGFAALLVLCGLPRLHHPVVRLRRHRARDGRPLFPFGSRASGGGKRQPEGASLRRESGADRGAAVMRAALVASLALALCGCTDQSMTQAAALRAERPRAGLRQWLGGADAAGRRRRCRTRRLMRKHRPRRLRSISLCCAERQGAFRDLLLALPRF